MSYFHSKNPNHGKFVRALERKGSYISWPFGIIFGHLVYSFGHLVYSFGHLVYSFGHLVYSFGHLVNSFTVLVRCTEKNLATLLAINLLMSIYGFMKGPHT
jgi:hypothetical protein